MFPLHYNLVIRLAVPTLGSNATEGRLSRETKLGRGMLITIEGVSEETQANYSGISDREGPSRDRDCNRLVLRIVG